MSRRSTRVLGGALATVLTAVVTVLAAAVAVPAAALPVAGTASAAAEPTSCRYWRPLSHTGQPVVPERDWTVGGGYGVLRSRPLTGDETHWNGVYEVCRWDGYETIENMTTFEYVTVETGWSGKYAGTLAARKWYGELGRAERFHFQCYPPQPSSPQGRGYCILWSEVTRTYVAAEGEPRAVSDPYHGILRARTPGANIGTWEIFYHDAHFSPL